MNTITVVCLSILYLVAGCCFAIREDRNSHRNLDTASIVIATAIWPVMLIVYGLGYMCTQYAQFVRQVNKGK